MPEPTITVRWRNGAIRWAQPRPRARPTLSKPAVAAVATTATRAGALRSRTVAMPSTGQESSRAATRARGASERPLAQVSRSPSL